MGQRRELPPTQAPESLSPNLVAVVPPALADGRQRMAREEAVRWRVQSGYRCVARDTHRILLTSLPTLFAYAPCSLLNFVLRLILKNTSSFVCVTTCITTKHEHHQPEPSAVAHKCKQDPFGQDVSQKPPRLRSQRTMHLGQDSMSAHVP